MKIFEGNYLLKPGEGASDDDGLPVTVMVNEDDADDITIPKVGRMLATLASNAANVASNVVNVASNAASIAPNMASVAMAAGNVASMATTALREKCVTFKNTITMPLLTHELRALRLDGTQTSTNNDTDTADNEEPTETINLALDHEAELLCFTMEISLDLGLPKTLCEAINGRDLEQWKDVIADEILNFLK